MSTKWATAVVVMAGFAISMADVPLCSILSYFGHGSAPVAGVEVNTAPDKMPMDLADATTAK